MATSATFFPAPFIAAPVFSVRQARGSAWSSMQSDLADYFECAPEAVNLVEIEWLPAERWAEFVEINGRVVGSLDDRLTLTEWRLVVAARIAHQIAA